MDPKPIVAGVAAVVLLAVHLSGDSDEVMTQTSRGGQTAVVPADKEAIDPLVLQAERRDEHFDKFRDEFLDTSEEKGQKEFHRRVSLLGQNPLEVSDAPELGGRDIAIGESPADMEAFVAEGGSVRRSNGLRPSQLREQEEER